jgi:flagellum-specific ATP synthase
VPIDNPFDHLRRADLIRVRGKVTQVIGLVIEATGQVASVGELCRIRPRGAGREVMAEVVGFRDDRLLLMPLGDLQGVGPGSEVLATGRPFRVGVGASLLGRIVDGLGRPMDGKGDLDVEGFYPIHQPPPSPLQRRRVTDPLPTGVRAIDGFLTVGRGQRVGIFAGSGVGKSMLLGMIARHTAADVNVIGLIGERGREVKDFIERDLGPEGLSRSALVAATSDEPPLVRRQAAFMATTIAESFRDRGKSVLLMMDSVTRFAQAQREIGLTIGEPPTTKGYPPSVFALLPKLLERAGTTEHDGSITGLYTILVEGDDLADPIADGVRAILDGHTILSRELAHQNHYPAIDVLQSVSRLMMDVTPAGHQAAAGEIRELLAAYRSAQDLINIGAYVAGSNPKIDRAIGLIERIKAYLRQPITERTEFKDAVGRLSEIAAAPMPGPQAKRAGTQALSGAR